MTFDLILTLWQETLAVEYIIDFSLTGADCIKYLVDNPMVDLACKLASEGDV